MSCLMSDAMWTPGELSTCALNYIQHQIDVRLYSLGSCELRKRQFEKDHPNTLLQEEANQHYEWLEAKNRLDIEMYEFMREAIHERERERERSGSGFTPPD